MTDLPKSIRVGYRDYSIELWAANHAMSAGRYGECDKANAVIRIDVSYGAVKAASTLLHEVLHACCDVGQREDEDSEERTVSVLSNQLAQVWRDNPDFVAFMSDSLNPPDDFPSEKDTIGVVVPIKA